MEKVHVRKLGELGHEPLELTPEEAVRLILSEQGRYFVVDEATRSLLREVTPEPGQRIALIPMATRG